MNFLRDRAGFFTVDVLVLSIIICSIASVWAILSYFNHIQILTNQRITAIFLAQGQLNKIENQIMTDKDVNLSESEKIILNDISFDINSNIIAQSDDVYLAKVSVTWQYDDVYKNEQQERELVKI